MSDFEGWVHIGQERGWCGPPVCSTHDGSPYSEAEIAEFEQGADPCVHVIRLYADGATKTAVEANHAPSLWRKP